MLALYIITTMCSFISTGTCCACHISCMCIRSYVEFGRSLSISGLACRSAATKRESDRSPSVLMLIPPKWLFDGCLSKLHSFGLLVCHCMLALYLIIIIIYLCLDLLVQVLCRSCQLCKVVCRVWQESVNIGTSLQNYC